MDKVDTYCESWLIKMFIWGLPQDQAIFVARKLPKTLSQAFQLARDAAMATLMSRRPGSRGQSESGRQKSFGRRQGQQTSQLQRRRLRLKSASSNDSKFVKYSTHSNSFGTSCGNGQAGSKKVSRTAAPANQSSSQQQQRSGHWRLRWNQRKPRAAGIAAQVEQGTAGPLGQEAAQHAATNRNRCVLVSVTRKLIGLHSDSVRRTSGEPGAGQPGDLHP